MKGASAPRHLRSARHEGSREGPEEICLWAGGAAIFNNRSRSVANSALVSSRGVRNDVADREHQPISGGVQDGADLIGERRAARCAVGAELGLVQLDEDLRLSARAIETVVEPFGRAVGKIGDDAADVEAEPSRSPAATRMPTISTSSAPIQRSNSPVAVSPRPSCPTIRPPHSRFPPSSALRHARRSRNLPLVNKRG